MSGEALMVLLVGFAASLAGTAWLRGYALRRRLLDVPNARSSHSVPTPRGGGAAIVVTTCLGTTALWLAGSTGTVAVLAMAVPGLAVAAVGFLDDRGHVSPGARLLVHFASAAWATWWFGGFASIEIASARIHLGPAGHVLAAIVIVWILNLFNFMDGIDGIAGSELVFVAAASAWLAGPSSVAWLPLLLLAAAGAGFLAFNWPPARIFMGDVGSGFIGFALASLAFVAHAEGTLSIWASVTLMGVFVADATVTLLVRLARGDSVVQAHRTHAYQRLSQRWRGHRPVTLGTWAVDLAWLLPWAWFIDSRPEYAAPACFAALLPLVVAAYAVGAGRHNASQPN